MDTASQPSPPATIPESLRLAAERFPDRLAVVESASTPVQRSAPSLDYQTLHQRAFAFSNHLLRHGVRPGEPVAFCLPGTIDEAVTLIAIAQCSAIAVTLSPKLTGPQAESVLKVVGFRWIVADAPRTAALRRHTAFAGCQWLSPPSARPSPAVTPPSPDLPAPAADAARPAPDDVAVIILTSGSSGMPRGVTITHRQFIDGTDRIDDYLHHTSADRLLTLLPTSAPLGVLQFTAAAAVGATVVLPPFPLASEIARVIREHSITGLSTMPVTLTALVEYLRDRSETLPGLRYVAVTGGVTPRPVLDALPSLLPGAEIFLTYGMSEAFRAFVLPAKEFTRQTGSLGRPAKGVEARVVAPDGSGLSTGTGELLLRGPLVTPGYWQDPIATRERIRPAPDGPDGPWLHTGDLVEIDPEGWYWYRGRIDGQLKLGGSRVMPEEIESLALRTPSIRHAVAFPAGPDATSPEVWLAVEPNREHGFDLGAFQRHCRQVMPSHMVPARVVVWETPFPWTGNGKIDRRKVVEESLKPQ